MEKISFQEMMRRLDALAKWKIGDDPPYFLSGGGWGESLAELAGRAARAIRRLSDIPEEEEGDLTLDELHRANDVLQSLSDGQPSDIHD